MHRLRGAHKPLSTIEIIYFSKSLYLTLYMFVPSDYDPLSPQVCPAHA